MSWDIQISNITDRQAQLKLNPTSPIYQFRRQNRSATGGATMFWGTQEKVHLFEFKLQCKL